MNTQQTVVADYSAAPSTIPAAYAGWRLDAALAKLLPAFSRSRLQSWLKSGQLTVDGQPADPKRKVLGGERIAVPADMPAESSTVLPEDIALTILFEDAHLLVIDKPAGLVVHPGSGNWSGTMMNALLHHAPQLADVPRAGIVHRLDKDTSGLLVVAKTLIAQTDLVRQLQARSVARRYLALVHGRLERNGTIDAPIGRHPSHRTRMAVINGSKGGGFAREARTHYEVKEWFEFATLVECRLETGRTHQIRVHMTELGYPLVGDLVYGKRRVADERLNAFQRQALHAWRLGLIHPASRQAMAWESQLPDDFSSLLERLRHE